VGQTLANLRQSAAGRFFKKFQDDRGTSLAILLAWGTLNTLFPLLLGMSALAGLVLQDEQRLTELTTQIAQLFPEQVAANLAGVLQDTRKSAAALGIIGFALLLFNGSGFFVNMQSVFNQAYHAEDRGFVGQRAIGLLMLLIATILLVGSGAAFGIGSFLATAGNAVFEALPFEVPGRGLVGVVTGSAVSIILALATFVLLYRILPNVTQTWRQALPGAVLVAMLFFVIIQVFPLYMALFGQGFQTYALFGIFLLMMFWCYVLGIILVLGAELNAFLKDPALAERSALRAAAMRAPSVQARERGQVGQERREEPRAAGRRGLKGVLVGLAGLLAAGLMLRRRPNAS
jgi:membrane protein